MNWIPHILYEDNHYIAISKPAGLTVQSEGKDEEAIIPLLQDFIGKRDKKTGKAFIGVLHRLDKLVSGVLILAKTSKGQERFNGLLNRKEVSKYYVAITGSKRIPTQGTLRHYISRKTDDYKMHISLTRKSNIDQEAVLNYKIIGQSGETQCWGIELITGRRHQIRAQLAYVGCPILGDKRYGQTAGNTAEIALHCVFMSFEHPIKKEYIQVIDRPDPGKMNWKDYQSQIRQWVHDLSK